jgi:hypothetical protein
MVKLILLFAIMIIGSTFQSYAQFKSAQGNTETMPEQAKQTPSFPSGDQFKNAKLTYKIIAAANNTWCYDIMAEGRIMIHQPSAPGLPGNEGFKTKSKAIKVAELVIEKIKNGEMPPSISIDEMKKIGAL